MNDIYEEATATAATATFEHPPTVVIYDNSGNQVNEFHVVNEKAEVFDETQVVGLPAGVVTQKQVLPSTANVGKVQEEIKSKFWTHEATLWLIGLYKTYQESMKDPRIKKKDVWNRIAADMAANGYHFHGDMCDKKWRNLKKSYHGVLENNRGPGQGRRLWQYFDLLNEIFSKEAEETVPSEVNPDGDTGPTTSTKTKPKSALNAATEMSLAQKLSEGKISTKMLREFFDKQERNEERRMNQLMEELRKMHDENLEVMKERNNLLQRLVDSLSSAT